jgi:hypothetical protein
MKGIGDVDIGECDNGLVFQGNVIVFSTVKFAQLGSRRREETRGKGIFSSPITSTFTTFTAASSRYLVFESVRSETA